MIVLTQTFNFRHHDQQAKIFKDEEFEIACKVLKKSYEKYLQEESNNEFFPVNKESCIEDFKSGYAKVVYEDGDYTEWQIIKIDDEFE